MTEANTDVLQIICEQTHCDNDDFSALCENEAYKPYADSDQLESCCLCSEGIKIQNEFIEHLQNEHPNEWSPGQDYKVLQCCDCSEGIHLQVELINHLLSHMFIARKETESQIDVGSSNFQIEVEQETLQEKDMRRIKPRPRYKNKFNRRDRSPTTENIQKEFTKDPKTERYHCNFCRNVYIRKQSVELHLSREHDPRKVSRRFSHEINDLEFSLDPKTNKFSCKICSNTYKYKQSVERHLVSQHNVVVSKIRLTNGITSSLKKSSSCPEKEKKDKLLMCDWCGQSFKFRESLRKHLVRHVASEPKRNNADKVAREKIVCDQCTKLVNPSLMKRHFQVHHSDYRPFRCEEPGCSTTFFDVTKFNDHKNIHLKIKPHICEFCQESFHYASNLRQHKLRHTDPERFKCDICSHCFVSTKSLRLHMRLHTEVDPDAPKPFVCSYEGCFKAFTYSDRLKLHIFNVHRTESEYKCRLCSFTSHRKKYHTQHMLKIHNIREGNPRLRVFPV